MGSSPKVCDTGAVYGARHLQCERGLLTNGAEHRQKCVVEIRKNSESMSWLTEVSPGEFVLVTWGEEISTHCSGQETHKEAVKPGVYLIDIPHHCKINGDGWTINPLREHSSRVSIKTKTIQNFVPIGLTDLVKETAVIPLLEDQEWMKNELSPVVRRTLEPIPVINNDVKWSHKISVSTWITIAIAVILIIIGLLIVIVKGVKVYLRNKKQNCKPIGPKR